MKLRPLLIPLALSIPLTALAGWSVDASTEHAIGVSGHQGQVHAKKAHLKGITVQTVNDLACKVGLKMYGGNGQTTWLNQTGFESCAVAAATGSPSTESVELASDEQVVHAVQVCTRKTNDSRRNGLAGVRIWGSRIEMGSAMHRPQQFQAVTGDCDQWHDKLECPAGEVVSALRGHHNGTTYTGLSVSCVKVVPGGNGNAPRSKAKTKAR